MEIPPKALKEKFPMCDAFLKVEWINKEKKIGYSNYEAILKNKKNQITGKKMMWALVVLDVPRIDYDVSYYKQQGRLKEIFDGVRNGEVEGAIPLVITYKGKTNHLHAGGAVNDEAFHPLLSDHQKTVCVVYPNEQRAWIVEEKSAQKIYDNAYRKDFPANRTCSIKPGPRYLTTDGKSYYINNQCNLTEVTSPPVKR
jgi:hypothetical protein